MKNKHVLFHDAGGSVELAGIIGNDLAVLNGSPAAMADLSDEDKKVIEHLIEQDQSSTLEHCSFKFKICAPMFVAKEHMCHSGWVCNEIDKYSATPSTKFYQPDAYRPLGRHGFDEAVINPVLQDKVKLGRFRVYRATKALSLHHESALRLYKHMVEAGICREQAKAALPQNVYIEYYASANLKDALRFVNLVDDEKTLPELRELAAAMLAMIRNEFPVTTEKWRSSTKKRQTNVAVRLAKLASLVDISEKLIVRQSEKIKKAQEHMLEKNKEILNSEDNLSEEKQGAGSPKNPEENRRKARWRFWEKNRGSG